MEVIIIKTLTIGENDSEQRVDKFLTKALNNLPSSLLYKFIRTKKIKVNGKRTEIGYKLQTGDILNFYISDEFFEKTQSRNEILFSDTYNYRPDLSIVYEDENILLADKKVGVKVHPDNDDECNTLIDNILAYLYRKNEYNPKKENFFVPALCNRIDRNTGGIVICAKNSQSLRIMNEKIKNNELKKLYYCIIHGILKNKKDILTAYHKKDPDKNIVKIYKKQIPQSKPIVTKYRVIKENPKENLSLLEVELVTGRTHQIRAHFSFLGFPLLGDGKYGINKTDREAGYKFQTLYSHSVTFLFKKDAGILNYLNNKTFKVKKVEFAENFKNQKRL